jgi:hypothetical protein
MKKSSVNSENVRLGSIGTGFNLNFKELELITDFGLEKILIGSTIDELP